MITEHDINDLLTELDAVLLAPGKFVEAHPHGVSDEGSIGGDVQDGPAWSRRFVCYDTDTGMWEVINDAFYLCACDHDGDDRMTDHDGDGEPYERCKHCGMTSWIANQTEIITCRDFRDPGGTEESADVTYNGNVGDFDWQITDEYAKQCAAALRAEYYD